MLQLHLILEICLIKNKNKNINKVLKPKALICQKLLNLII